MSSLCSHLLTTHESNLSFLDEFAAQIHSIISSVFDNFKRVYKEEIQRVNEETKQKRGHIEYKSREMKRRVREKVVEDVEEVEREVQEGMADINNKRVFEGRLEEGFKETVVTWVMKVDREVFLEGDYILTADNASVQILDADEK